MKRIFFVLFSLLTAVFSIACSSNIEANKVLEIQPNELNNSIDNEIPSLPSRPKTESGFDFGEGVLLSVPYQYGNMQKNRPAGNYMDYGDKIIFQNINTGATGTSQFKVFTMDKTTHDVQSLCRDATCKHNNSTKCVSSQISGNLEQYNGQIFALDRSGYVVTLDEGGFTRITDGPVDHFWHSRGVLFAVTKDGSLVVFEDGNKKPYILIDEYVASWNVEFDNILFGDSIGGTTGVNLTETDLFEEIVVPDAISMIDGERIYFADNKTYILYRCNMDGSDVVQLTERPVLMASLNFDEDYLYFRYWDLKDIEGEDSHTLYRLAKKGSNKPEPLLELPDSVIYTVYTVPDYDWLIVKTWIPSVDGDSQKRLHETYLVAKDGSNIELLEIPDI